MSNPKRTKAREGKLLDYSRHQDPELLDFRNFVFIVWKHLRLPVPTPAQYDIAHRLQHGPTRDIIEAFRGVGKSYITVAFVLWRLYWDPQIKVEVISAAKNLADNFSTFALRLLFEMPELEWLRPDDDQRTSKVQFDVKPALASKDPSVKSVGITGQITGSRADLLIADDVEVPSNSATQIQRDKLAELVKEFDAILKPGGQVKYLGTPQTEMSLYNTLPQRGYSCYVLPALFPSDKELAIYGERLAPFVKDAMADGAVEGTPTDPKRFNAEDLLERKLSYGRSGFALQFQLNTSLSDLEKYPLRLSDLIVMSCDGEYGPGKAVWATSPELSYNDLPVVGLKGDRFYRPMEIKGGMQPYQGAVLVVDPAGRGSNEMGYAVTKMLNSQIIVAASGGLRGGPTVSNLETLAKLAKAHKVNHVLIESNFGDGNFGIILTPYFNRIYPVTIEEVKSNKQKELRIIEIMEPLMNQHRLIIDTKVIEQDYRSAQEAGDERGLAYSLFYQMTRLTKERGSLAYDDRIDALAYAVDYWMDHMAKDQDEAIAEFEDGKIDRALQDFAEHVFNTKPQSLNWLNN